MRKHVWIAIPAYTGQIHLGTFRSITTDLLTLHERGDMVTVFDESGNAMIGDCRGIIAKKFLESGATDLVFVDSDVVWEAGGLVSLVDRDVEFVAGIYPQRKDPIKYCVQWLDRKELWAVDGLLEVMGVPAGFMRLKRSVIEKMVAAYPETAFQCSEFTDDTCYDLFGPWRDGKFKFGEDYSFCRRWREIGGQIWIDPEILMGHVGFKTFYGRMGDWLKNRG